VLTKLCIQNFKAWSDTKTIRLAPLTVFFGGNSAGKTSLLQFLLMLRQTAESTDRRRVLHPGDRNTPVELGTYRDLVFDHDLGRKIRFAVEWLLPEPLVIRNPVTRTSVAGKRIQFSAEIASDRKGGRQSVTFFRYDFENNGQGIQVTMKAAGSGPSVEYELSAGNYKLARNRGRAWKLPEPVRFYGFPDEVAAYYRNAVFTSDLALALERQLKRIQYLGPLRTYPERSYVWSGEVPEHVGWRGERAVEAMLAAASRKISAGYRQRAKPFQAVVARWLQDLGLLDGFQVKAIAAHRKEFEVLVRTPKSKQTVNLTDVGFGVSQILPVVVQCFYAAPGATILLEQPEIHLHASVQTALADLFIETVRSREDGGDRSIQVIVESHSEHFLRRLQRRVAEGAIQPDQVALYFCESGENGAELHPLEVNLYGEIQNWPDGFFGDELGELAARMDAAARREAVRE